MGGQRIEPGTTGPVWTTLVDPGSVKHGDRRPAKWRSRTRLCLLSGTIVPIERSASTKRGAESLLKAFVRDRLTAETEGAKKSVSVKLGSATEAWIVDMAEDTRLSTKTREIYAAMARKHLIDSPLADRLPRSLTAGDVEDRLRQIALASGPGAAKTTRSVWSKVMARAVRHGLVERNVVREAEPTGYAPTTVRPEREHDRALTAEETVSLLLYAYRTPRWRTTKDVADLAAFMLSAGVRIGEALAIRWCDVSLRRHTVSINATIVRITGQGLVRQPRPKTDSSEREIPIHPRTAALLRRRAGISVVNGGQDPIFPSPRAGTWRDPSNTSHDMADLLADAGLVWATSHTFRRTVITRLGDRGVPLRLLADMAGHSDPSMTARKYLGRRGANDALRAAL